jgi:chemotaxis receptor (MCP) glutamine deamidase CheD
MPTVDETMPEIYVLPGESHLVVQPTIIRTVLGSCVGVTFCATHRSLGTLSSHATQRVRQRA